jgi:transposase-like protein
MPSSVASRHGCVDGYRFPPDVILLAVRWFLRYGLSYRDLTELLAERGVDVDHVTIYRWEQRFTPLAIQAARPCRHNVGDRWFVDETSLPTFHIDTTRYANNRIECDHRRLKSRPPPMRGLRTDRTASTAIRCHAVVIGQNWPLLTLCSSGTTTSLLAQCSTMRPCWRRKMSVCAYATSPLRTLHNVATKLPSPTSSTISS